MKQRIRVIFEYLAAFMLIALLLMAIFGVVVVKFYGEQLQAFVIEQVNRRLDSKVVIGDASVKVFHRFPQTSMVLTDVTVWSSHNFRSQDFEGEGADTLLTAGTVSISFNPFSLLRKKYNIRQFEISHGILHIYTDSGGEGNYRIIAGEHHDAPKTEQQLNLSQLKVTDFRVILDNRAKMLSSSGTLRQLELNGKFSRGQTRIRSSLEGYLEETSNKGILYASEREVKARLQMDVNDSLYTIETGQLQIDRILADVDGQFRRYRGNGLDLDIYATARDLEIHEVLDLLPRKLSNPLQEIRGNGILQLYTRIRGMVSATLTPQIEADFQTTDANLQWDRLPFSVKSLNLTGTYSNGGKFSPLTTTLLIESLSAVVGDDQITGTGKIHNFLDPDFSFEMKGVLHPDQWLRWYESIPLHEASGSVTSDIRVTGSYDRNQPRGDRFSTFDVEGGIALDDVSVQIKKGGIPFTGVNGTLHIQNDFWEPSFEGKFGESDFSIQGTGLNVLSFLIHREEELLASATFHAERMDLQEILDQLPGRNSERKAGGFFPDRLHLNLKFSVDEFRKGKLTADRLRGNATYDTPILSVDSFSMQTMEGMLDGKFRIAREVDGNIRTNVNAHLDHVDIQQLFYTFNNFGQSQLTHEHLKGSISGNTVFSATFDSTFRIKPATILSENEVVIEKGELNGFSPMLALSRFIEVEDLENIQFERLENTVLLKESQVIIPVMDIQSNALDLIASGTHGFNNHYDYRVQLRLSDLLYSKTRGSASSEFEIAEDASDTRTLFLRIYNEGEGPDVVVDREKTARKIRDDLRQERSEIKGLLNRELGLFGNGGEVENVTPQNQQEPVEFRFEFDASQDTLRLPEPEPQKRRWWQRKTKKDTTQNKPAMEFVIDE